MNARQRTDRDHSNGRHTANPIPDICFGCAALASQRDFYLNLADEASAPDFDRADFDAEPMAAADALAARLHLPKFDEVADIDHALDLVQRAEQNDR